MYTFSQINRIFNFNTVYLYAFERNTIYTRCIFFPLLITTMYSFKIIDIIVLKLTYSYNI